MLRFPLPAPAIVTRSVFSYCEVRRIHLPGSWVNKGYGAPMTPTRIGGTVSSNPCSMSMTSVRFEVLGMR
jgi:hypothetical protein